MQVKDKNGYREATKEEIENIKKLNLAMSLTEASS